MRDIRFIPQGDLCVGCPHFWTGGQECHVFGPIKKQRKHYVCKRIDKSSEMSLLLRLLKFESDLSSLKVDVKCLHEKVELKNREIASLQTQIFNMKGGD